MPGFTADSLYPKMLDMAGIPPRELIEGLIENALGRA
jgi:D-alanine-D-alanine ligase-like ATP-grasp enzyme